MCVWCVCVCVRVCVRVCVCVCVCTKGINLTFSFVCVISIARNSMLLFATTSRMMMMVGMTSYTDKFFRNHHDHTEGGEAITVFARSDAALD